MAARKLTAGDSATWSYPASCHPAADGWALSLHLAGPSSLAIDLLDGEARLTPAQSAALAPGRYQITLVATRPNERATLERGELEVLPDPLSPGPAPVDARSQARRILEAVEAKLEGRATSGQDSVQIAGRAIKNTSITELIVLRDKYAAIVAREPSSGGNGFGRKIHVRWGR